MRSRIKQHHALSTSSLPGKDENDNTKHLDVQHQTNVTKGRKPRKDNLHGPPHGTKYCLKLSCSTWCKGITCSVLLFLAFYVVIGNVHTASEKVLNLILNIGFHSFDTWSRTGSDDKNIDNIRDSLAGSQGSISLQDEKPSSDNVRGNIYPSNIPRDVLDFKPSIIKEFMPKPITVFNKVIKPIQLRGEKDHSNVRVYIYEDFLTPTECDGLRRAHDNHVRDTASLDPILCFNNLDTLQKHLVDVGQGHLRVTTQVFTEGTTCLNTSFSSELKQWMGTTWSYSTAFYPGESRFTHTFTERVERATGLGHTHGGKFQITSYPQGVGYRSHTDCMVAGSELRDRYATFLVYLQDVEEGGETIFTDLGLTVKPKKGRALTWTNMDRHGRCQENSIHEAAPVIQGHKYILQRWYYFQNFYSLGKRLQEPSIPLRHPGQPRVTCDQYEHGSCRWYDEWNFEHIPQYEKQKQNLL